MVPQKARDLHKMAYLALMGALVVTHKNICDRSFTITLRASIDDANRRPEKLKPPYLGIEALLHVVSVSFD